MKNKKRAFTLTELLVVVIVLGTLAAVAVPKFSRVLETRRTGEAEAMLSAVRTEQEKRCTLGQDYTGDFSKMTTVAYAKNAESQGQTGNYTYTLTSTGVEASRSGKDYVLKIPSYKTGEICCEGSGCDALNKSYPSCASLSLPAVDECAAEDVVVPTDPCDSNPNSCSCSSYAASHKCECDANYANANACECNPSTETCCGEGEEWDAASGSCKPVDDCVDQYSAGARTANATDTCDGDKNGKYTCDGSVVGACTDVYILQASGSTLSSAFNDPFSMFKESVLLAATCQNGQIPDPDTGLCQVYNPCKMGYFYNSTTGRCEDLETVDISTLCADGYVWDDTLGSCVKLWGDVTISTSTVLRCPDGYTWNAALKQCVKNTSIAQIYFSRDVVCCAREGEPEGKEETCDENPNQEKCCSSSQTWNGSKCVSTKDPCQINPSSCSCSTYAEAHKCECSPSASNCCTATQIKGGMIFNSSSKTCVCPSGKSWNTSTSKCEDLGKRYTCFTGYKSQTIPNPNYNPDLSGGSDKLGAGWYTTYATTDMKCGSTASTQTYTYRKGQEANCNPGQAYLYVYTYGHKAGPNQGYDKYFYTCLYCSSVSDLSECGNFTVSAPTNSDTGNGGYVPPAIEKPETGFQGAQ